MERLTEWRGEHAAVVNHHVNYIDRLARYEDAVEKGLLVACPCKVFDMAYYIRGTTIYGDTVERIVIDGLDNVNLRSKPALPFSAQWSFSRGSS